MAPMPVSGALTKAGGGRAARRPKSPPAATASLPAAVAPVEPPDPPASRTPQPVLSTEQATDMVPPFTQELRLVRIDASTAPARYEVLRW